MYNFAVGPLPPLPRNMFYKQLICKNNFLAFPNSNWDS